MAPPNLDGYLPEAVKLAYAMGQRDAIVAMEQSLGAVLQHRLLESPDFDLEQLLQRSHGRLALEGS